MNIDELNAGTETNGIEQDAPAPAAHDDAAKQQEGRIQRLASQRDKARAELAEKASVLEEIQRRALEAEARLAEVEAKAKAEIAAAKRAADRLLTLNAAGAHDPKKAAAMFPELLEVEDERLEDALAQARKASPWAFRTVAGGTTPVGTGPAADRSGANDSEAGHKARLAELFRKRR